MDILTFVVSVHSQENTFCFIYIFACSGMLNGYNKLNCVHDSSFNTFINKMKKTQESCLFFDKAANFLEKPSNVISLGMHWCYVLSCIAVFRALL